MQRILWGLIAVAAVAGWVVAFVGINRSNDLKTKLAASETERAALSETLAAAQVGLRKYRHTAGQMKILGEQIDAVRAELDRLTRQTEAKNRQLLALAQKIETGKAELAALAPRIEAGESEATGLKQQIALARIELERLQAEARRSRKSAVRSEEGPPARQKRQTTPEPKKTAAPSSPTTTAGAQERDLTTEARRRFRVIDKNGDDMIDPLEFRLNKVAALSLIDANRDGYVTLDETLLTPDKFKRIDADGDGKISSVEFVDLRSFNTIDENRDRSVTFEEYLSFIRATAR